MSADTTILILKLPTGYRVATVSAVENITHHKDASIVAELYKDKTEYTTLDEAFVEAAKEEERHVRIMGYSSEYGIQVYIWNKPIDVDFSKYN